VRIREVDEGSSRSFPTPTDRGINKVNLTFRRITATTGLLFAVLAAVTALTAPVQPPRVYAAGAATIHFHTMPSDPPVIRG